MGDGTGRRAPHVGALDGLRGAAVLGVLLFHLAPLDGGDRDGLLGGGWLGVDAFFTLSGYLITSLLLAEAAGAGGRIDLRAFWRRRLRRLQPAALVAVAGVAASAAWWSPAGTAEAVREQALAALGAVANWQALWADRAYAAGDSASAFEHFWSLAVEEQFYVVWPLVVALLAGGRRRVRLAALVGTAASWLLLAASELQRGYLGTDTRMGSILLGAALATVLPLDRRAATDEGAERAVRATWAGLAVVAGLWLLAGWEPNAPLGLLLPLHAIATAAVLAGVVLAPWSQPARLLAARPLALVGKVSYGVYLWHWPVFVLLTPERLGAGWLVTTSVRLAVVGILTAASWYLVEHPVRADVVLRRTRVALPAASVAVVLTALVAAAAVDPAPAWARADGRVIASTTPTTQRVGAPRVLVVGDSIPTSLLSDPEQTLQAPAGRLLEQLAERGVAAWAATVTGCPVSDAVIVVDGQPRYHCLENQGRVTRAVAEVQPDLVVWYARQDVQPVVPGTPKLATRIADRVGWFAERGARVLFVAPGPNRGGGDLEPMRRLEAAFERVAQERPADVAGIVRMSELLCGGDERRCPDTILAGGTYRDVDGMHFGHPGGLLVGQWLADRIAVFSGAAAPPAP